MSGIEIDSDIPTLFNEMKLRSTHKWATFKISDDKKKIEVDELGEPKVTEDKDDDKVCFDELKTKLKKEAPRYILYDFGFRNKEDRVIKKLAFIFWCNDDAPVKAKMLSSSSKDTIKKAFSGLSLEFQANDEGDFDYSSYQEEVAKKA